MNPLPPTLTIVFSIFLFFSSCTSSPSSSGTEKTHNHKELAKSAPNAPMEDLQSEACLGIMLGTAVTDNDEIIRRQVDSKKLNFLEEGMDKRPFAQLVKIENLPYGTLYYRFRGYVTNSNYLYNVSVFVTPNSYCNNEFMKVGLTETDEFYLYNKKDYIDYDNFLIKTLSSKYGNDYKITIDNNGKHNTLDFLENKETEWKTDKMSITLLTQETNAMIAAPDGSIIMTTKRNHTIQYQLAQDIFSKLSQLPMARSADNPL